jgi:hypothetical protein
LDGFGKLYQEISGNPGPDPPLSTRKDVFMTDGGKKSKQVNLVEVQGCQMVYFQTKNMGIWAHFG